MSNRLTDRIQSIICEQILQKSKNMPKKLHKFSLYVEILTVMFTNSMFAKTNQLVSGGKFFE